MSVDEQVDLLRVAVRPEAVTAVSQQLEQAYARRWRFRWLPAVLVGVTVLMLLLVLAVLLGLLLGSDGLLTAAAVSALAGLPVYTAAMVAGGLTFPTPKQRLIDRLLQVVRAIENPQYEPHRISWAIELASQSFYSYSSRTAPRRRGSRQYQRQRLAAAESGAAAIASYVTLLAEARPDVTPFGDQFRRMMLRVSADRVSEVAELAIEPLYPWTPPGLRRKLTSFAARENGQKVIVALVVSVIGVATAIAVALIKLTTDP